ncbi:uncharacterized protein LOC127253901 [Andrographis paniculata]|uniref:uncharacterized protein LOC127253901 n=1 Tax=Andrographis paniculata TaxID=175694 RepID=UPI0021E867A3|nr:uncharacterized protein LOC127253901 [Andrographis paniculata]
MIVSNNLSHKTHYEIIGVKEDASQEEIRKVYRTAILNHHPDKVQSTCEADLGNAFIEVQKAWEILSNPRSRALYDNELQTLRQDVNIEDVSIEDMTVKDDGVDGNCFELSHHCRCGDTFSLDSSELQEIGCLVSRNGCQVLLRIPGSSPASIILPCGTCSLKVRLLIDSNITLHI